MALSALAVENKKLNHKRPELRPVPWEGGGECVALSEGGQGRGRRYWFQKSSAKPLSPELSKQGQMRDSTKGEWERIPAEMECGAKHCFQYGPRT